MNKWVVLVWYLGFDCVCFHIQDSLFITLVRLGVIVIICTCNVQSVAMTQQVIVFSKLGIFSTTRLALTCGPRVGLDCQKRSEEYPIIVQK